MSYEYGIPIVLGYLLVVLGGAVFARSPHTGRGFTVGSKDLPTLITFGTLAATCIGPGFSLGLIEKTNTNGWIWLLIYFAFSLQMVISGILFAPRIQRLRSARTLGDIVEHYYNKSARIIYGIITILFCTGVLGAIAKVVGVFAYTLVGIPANVAAALSLIFVIAYSAAGGIKGVVITDLLQFVILSVALPLTALLFLPEVLSPTASATPLPFSTGLDTTAIVGIAVSFFLGEFLIPPYTQRALMARTEADAKKAYLFLSVYSIPWFITMAGIAVISTAYYPLAEPGARFSLFVSQQMHPVLVAIILVTVISIVASTQSSLLHSASVSFSDDLLGGASKLTEQGNLKASRYAVIVIGTLALIFSLYVPSIVDGLLIVYNLWAPAMTVPLAYALLARAPNRQVGAASMLLGCGASILWNMLPLAGTVPSILVGIAASALPLVIFRQVPLVLVKE